VLGPQHRGSLSISSHPWRPRGSPNVSWKALGGVNKNQTLTKNKFKKKKVVKRLSVKKRSHGYKYKKIDRQVRCMACGLMSNM
jgi:hypothetical protein